MSGDTILPEMKHFLPRWDFSFMDVVGKYDGLLTGWKKNHILHLNS